MSGQLIVQVDAFTDQAFAGNPAAVCFLEEEADPDWMQLVAVEMNLSETAFIRKLHDGYELRWFTPAFEVDLCGHATLGAAHALWEEKRVPLDTPIRFHSRSGVLTCTFDPPSARINLDFPSVPARPVEHTPELFEALGISQAKYVGENIFDSLVVVDSEDVVRGLQPDMGRLAELQLSNGSPVRGTMVTSLTKDPNLDFVSRYFAPAAGVNEDPVTGSAHCCLGPYWASELGKTELTAFQASKRGGIVHIVVGEERVTIGGFAVTTLRGHLV